MRGEGGELEEFLLFKYVISSLHGSNDNEVVSFSFTFLQSL